MASTVTNRRQGLNTGAAVKVACKVATTADITLSGEQTIDGIACSAGDRVLVKEQDTGSENGIYVVSTSTWQRDKDFDGKFDVVEGTLIPVARGDTYGGQVFSVTNTGTITIGTTALTFELALDSSTMSYTPTTGALSGIATTVKAFLDKLGDAGTSLGAALIGFTQSGSGTITRNLQDKSREIVSITDFKNDDNTAVSTSVADNSTGLQRAADDGRALYIPPGTFNYATGMQFPRRGSTMWMRGAGQNSSILKYNGTGKAISFKEDIDNTIQGVHFGGFQVDCSGGTATHGIELTNGATGNGHRWASLEDLYLIGTTLNGTPNAGSVGVKLQSARYVNLKNVVCREWDKSFELEEIDNIPCSNIIFESCLGYNPITAGFYVNGTGNIGITFLRSAVEADTQVPEHGFYIEGPTSTKADSITLDNCWVEDDYSVASYYFENCRGVRMVGCFCGVNPSGAGLKLVNVRSSKFLNNNFDEEYDTYAIDADSQSVLNEFTAYIRDTRNLGAVNIANTQNTHWFQFSSNGTSPHKYGCDGPAVYIRSHDGNSGTISPRDTGMYVVDTSGGNVTFGPGTVNAQNEGVEFEVVKGTSDANLVTINPASSQTIDGALTFVLRYPNESVKMRADSTLGSGTGGWRITARHVPPRPPIVNTTAVGNVGTGSDVLQSDVVPANAMIAAGDGIHVVQQGTVANNTNTKALESQLGGTDLFTDQALTVSVASRWRVEYDLISTGSNTQMYEGILTYEAPAGTWVSRPFGGTLTLDQTAVFSVRCRGTVTDGGGGVNNDDIVQTFQKIEFIRRQT